MWAVAALGFDGGTNDFGFVGDWAVEWMAGVFLMFGRYSVSCVSVRRFRRRGVCCAPEAWQREVERLTALLRISRTVRLLESCLAETPTVIGHVRPLILMPVGMLAGLSPTQIESILLHELAHIQRHDYLMNTLQRYVEGLLFYHPPVLWPHWNKTVFRLRPLPLQEEVS